MADPTPAVNLQLAVALQVEVEPLLPIPVATEKRPDPRLALTIGVAGWIADPKDFGTPSLMDLVVAASVLKLHPLDWCKPMHASTSALCCVVLLLVQRSQNLHLLDCVSGQGHMLDAVHFNLGDMKPIICD